MSLINNNNSNDHLIRVKEGQLIFALNEDKTASIVSNDSPIDDLIIPRTIKYNNQEFIVTSVKKNSFKHIYHLRSIQFPLDSEVRTIEKDSFIDCRAKEILLPPSITNLCDGWIMNHSDIYKVKMITNNQYYKNYGKEYVIGKSDPNNSKWDLLVYANRFVKEFKIPKFIHQLSSNSFSFTKITSIFIPPQVTKIGRDTFSRCHRLRSVKFHPDSQIQRIEDGLFDDTIIVNVTFPRKVKSIGQYVLTS